MEKKGQRTVRVKDLRKALRFSADLIRAVDAVLAKLPPNKRILPSRLVRNGGHPFDPREEKCR